MAEPVTGNNVPESQLGSHGVTILAVPDGQLRGCWHRVLSRLFEEAWWYNLGQVPFMASVFCPSCTGQLYWDSNAAETS